MKPRLHSKPDQRILTVLERSREVTARELGSRTKMCDSSIYRRLRQLEEQGKIKHHYQVGKTGRLIKHYQLNREVKNCDS